MMIMMMRETTAIGDLDVESGDGPQPRPPVTHVDSLSDELSLFSQRSSDDIRSSARGANENHNHANPTDNNKKNNRRSNNDEGAEGIVRAEEKTIRNIRFALICLIIAAATACGILIYKLSSKNENDSFKYNFDAVASRLSQSFISIVGENLNYAFMMSVSISSGVYSDSDYRAPYPNVTIAQFDTLTYPARVHGLVTNVIWAPLIFTRDERQAWETYALDSLASKQYANSTSQYPPCYFCGEGHELSRPDAVLTFPSVGKVPCNMIQQGALGGYVGPSVCNYYRPSVVATCGCRQSSTGSLSTDAAAGTATNSTDSLLARSIFRLDNNGKPVIDHTPPPYSPVWQVAPSVNSQPITMFNQMSEPWRREAISDMIDRKTPTFSRTVEPKRESIYSVAKTQSNGNFVSFYFPVFQALDSQKLVGSLSMDISWASLFSAVLPQNSDGITIVLENTFGQVLTYQVENGVPEFRGEGDFHDSHFDSMLVHSTFEDFNELVVIGTLPNVLANKQIGEFNKCSYRIRIYPSQEFRNKHVTNKPVVFTVIVVMAFVVTSLVFLTYDYIVRRLQSRVLDSAMRSEAIVSSLFPALVRDRLFRNGATRATQESEVARGNKQGLRFDFGLVNHKARLMTFLSHPPSLDIFDESEPIADLYPNTTIMFADIAGFTAWSSEREPSQVFKLLECLYGEFDDIARELGVFKVETIGDCYVAVTGLPEKMKHHAVVMVEFAVRCLTRMHEMVSKLELVLGPGTADLAMRVGLHSGPVTAGVLRSERARFQLFGDTMNVASRMESTGKPDRVHVSKETAELLIDAGKEHWITTRKEFVSVKGKGSLQTYWAKPIPRECCIDTTADPILETIASCDGNPTTVLASTVGGTMIVENNSNGDNGVWGSTSLEHDSIAFTKPSTSSGRDRLVEWNTDLLQGLLQKVVAKNRNALVSNNKVRASAKASLLSESNTASISGIRTSSSSSGDNNDVQFIDEITEVIEMPSFDERIIVDPSSIDLGPAVRSQLRNYVASIASKYRDNAFHNFEHACHVAMSASKLLKRIIVPDDVNYHHHPSTTTTLKNNKSKCHNKALSKEIHDTTFGISSDPLMQFAVVFSALIHDVDHSGLTNQQLIDEDNPLAIQYRGKCVAEQRSIQVAWDTLMEDGFADLRRCICPTEDEMQRFRQLLVNAVIATDIADKELSAWRKNRWDKVFHHQQSQQPQESSSNNSAGGGGGSSVGDTMCDARKATIVFEYIIQASDVAHTMQHWHVYQKWNKRLFDERYGAYLAGHHPDVEQEDPSIGWHKGEIWFFDNYVIPLAKKLEECNVFGVSCDEYLTYALQNRHEWEMKGEDIVNEMVSSYTNQGNHPTMQ